MSYVGPEYYTTPRGLTSEYLAQPLARQAATPPVPGNLLQRAWARPAVRAGVPPLGLYYGSQALGAAAGGEAGDLIQQVGGAASGGYTAGQVGGAIASRVAPKIAPKLAMTLAPKLAGKGGWIGTGAAALLAGLQLTGLGKKLPVVGGFFGAEPTAGAATGGDTTMEDLEAYGANDAEANQIMNIVDRIRDVEGDEAAATYLQSALGTLRQRMETSFDARQQAMYDPLIAQAISNTMMPYRDTAIQNIEAARQSALKSGMPEVANQYFSMSKNVANAYAQQAVMFGPTSRLQKTMQGTLEAQTMGGTTGGGLFDQINAAGQQTLMNQLG